MIIKNSNIRSSLYENRYIIIVGILGVIFILSLIQGLNTRAKEENRKKINMLQNTTVQQNQDTPKKPVITGEEVSKEQQNENTKVMEQFIAYCNQQNIEKAYELLTPECQEEVFFLNLEYFKQHYVDRIFTGKKMITAQIWSRNYLDTYKVQIMDDMLSSGKTSSEKIIEDYFTLVTRDGSTKLNINGYIGRRKIQRQTMQDGIKVDVITNDIFHEYESYDIKVENTTDKTILLDSMERVDSMYLLGSNESHYTAYAHEMDISNFIIQPKQTQTITMRFNKRYSNQTNMQAVVFGDVITDYEAYQKSANKKDFTNRSSMQVEI